MSTTHYIRLGLVAGFQAVMAALIIYFDSIQNDSAANFFGILVFLVPFVGLVLIAYGIPILPNLPRIKRICVLAFFSFLLTYGAFQVWMTAGAFILMLIRGYMILLPNPAPKPAE